MTDFKLTTLGSYDDDALIAEIQRIANILPQGPITRRAFDAVARVATSTVVRRFGGWQRALARAGIGDRYQGRVVTEKMREQATRSLTNEELLDELRRVAAKLGARTITMEQFNKTSAPANAAGVKRRFGSWAEALRQAGLQLSPLGRRYSDDDYFDNLLAVWTHYTRQPTYAEMNQAPSRIPCGAYEAKFGGWRKALAAFVTRVASDRNTPVRSGPAAVRKATSRPLPPVMVAPGPRIRTIPLGLRYDVLRRDRFKCTVCGATPARDLTCTLHVDHIIPFSRGGVTEVTNLRTLCDRCNVGKGNKVDESCAV